jgi:16S rRNA (cytosine1402-N4)-methyltransferase
MALRIAVNEELDELEALLKQAPAMLAPGARIVIISFHSLEDRVVKHEFLEWARRGLGSVVTKKPVTPDDEEKRRNPAARSAKLRCFERAR